MKELEQLRKEIDAIDSELVKLFQERMALAREIAWEKEKAGLPIYDASREEAVCQSRLAWLSDETLADKLQVFFHTIMDLSKKEQMSSLSQKTVSETTDKTENGPKQEQTSQNPIEKALKKRTQDGKEPESTSFKPGITTEKVPETAQVKVAYAGVPGAYSHEALEKWFGNRGVALAYPDFAGVFQAVARGEAKYGVVPVENSTTGSIAQVYDLMMEFPASITGEMILPVRHCLLGLPGTRLSDIRQVYSHEQGFEQCMPFLQKNTGWEKRPYHNTALSAQYVKNTGDKEKAAIASQYAADTYGLAVLSANIQAAAQNSTRFFIIAEEPQEAVGNKVTFSFTLPHRSGSLYQALGLFAEKGWNLTRIESRPIPGHNFEYRFFADIEGDFTWEGALLMLKELGDYASPCRLLGLYEKAAREV